MPGRCTRGMGNGENTLHRARSESMARVGLQGPDGKEIPMNSVYDQVMIVAKYSQEDCRLDSLIDGIEKE